MCAGSDRHEVSRHDSGQSIPHVSKARDGNVQTGFGSEHIVENMCLAYFAMAEKRAPEPVGW